MTVSAVDIRPLAVDVNFAGEMLRVDLADGREIAVPLSWFPQLEEAAAKERKNWRLIGGGLGIHWQDLDQDISVESLLRLR